MQVLGRGGGGGGDGGGSCQASALSQAAQQAALRPRPFSQTTSSVTVAAHFPPPKWGFPHAQKSVQISILLQAQAIPVTNFWLI